MPPGASDLAVRAGEGPGGGILPWNPGPGVPVLGLPRLCLLLVPQTCILGTLSPLSRGVCVGACPGESPLSDG